MNVINSNKVYFIGIKGAGMSALACILKSHGYDVSGSDHLSYFFTQDNLAENNIPIFNFGELPTNCTYIVSAAYNKFNNQDVLKLEKQGTPYMLYNEAVAFFMNKYNNIAISGTHGKTTVTKLIGDVFSTQKKINLLIGDGTGVGHSDANDFIFEACEYRNHFLNYHPNTLVITNLDFDHPDFFESFEDVEKSFIKLVKQTKKNVVVFNSDKLENIIKLGNCVTFGTKNESHYQAVNVIYDESGISFDVLKMGIAFDKYKLPIFGEHMLNNVLCAIVVGDLHNISKENIQKGLLNFKPPKRRFNIQNIGHQIIIDDYGHHPKELEATRLALKQKYPNKKIVCIFQPHTYSRTEALKNDFIAVLKQFDKRFILNTFSSAREKMKTDSWDDDFREQCGAEKISESNVEILNEFSEAVLLFIGAGNVNDLIKLYKDSI